METFASRSREEPPTTFSQVSGERWRRPDRLSKASNGRYRKDHPTGNGRFLWTDFLTRGGGSLRGGNEKMTSGRRSKGLRLHLNVNPRQMFGPHSQLSNLVPNLSVHP